MFSERSDLTGKKFGKLTVVGYSHTKITKGNNKTVMWNCICECGNKKIVQAGNLKSNHTRSCGCLFSERVKHNIDNGWNASPQKKRIYAIWSGMLSRCSNKNVKAYKYYGGRGIIVEFDNASHFF